MSIYNHSARYIGPIGSRGSKVALVATCPRAKEQSLGQGFVSSELKVLQNMLDRAGIPSFNLYKTYVVKERPPRDDIEYYISFTKKNESHTQKYEMYKASLKKELEDWNGNVVVAIGEIPLYTLTGKRGVTKWRGSILESTLVPGLKVIPTIDPSIAMKQYMYTYLIMDDIVKVKENIDFADIRKRERDFLIRPSYYEAMEFLEEAATIPRIGTDIEGLHFMSCFSIATSETRAMSIPFVDGRGHYFTPDKEAEVIRKYAEILENEKQEHVFQNAMYDFDFLFNEYGIQIKNIQDSMIAHAITYPDYPKGLDLLTSIYTDMNYYKDEGKPGIKFGANDTEFWVYNARDSIACLESFNKCEEDLTALDNWETYNRQKSIIEPLIYMQSRGIKVDVEGLREASKHSDEVLEPLYEKLHELCGFEINPKSPKQLKEYFYGTLKVTPIKFKGKVTTGEIALKKLAAKGIKEASIIMEIRKLSKEQGTYFNMKFDDDNRFRTSFNIVGTKNGRLSSSKSLKGTGGNAQNIPYSVKKYYKADEGYVIYECDLSQAENRLMAYISPEPSMIEAFETGKDVHRKTASLIFNKPYEEISDEKGSSHLGNGTKSERYWGKTSNHSFNYDLGARSASIRFEITYQQAKFLIGAYHNAYPGIRRYHNWVREVLANENRELTNILGRTRRFLGRWEDSLFKEAYNFIPQSSVADIINEYGIRKIYFDQTRFKSVEILNQVHDSIVFQIPISIGAKGHEDIIRNIKKVLEPRLKWRSYDFVIPAEFKMGYNLKEMVEVEPGNWVEAKKKLDAETVVG